jgi:hypothetical protein
VSVCLGVSRCVCLCVSVCVRARPGEVQLSVPVELGLSTFKIGCLSVNNPLLGACRRAPSREAEWPPGQGRVRLAGSGRVTGKAGR